MPTATPLTRFQYTAIHDSEIVPIDYTISKIAAILADAIADKPEFFKVTDLSGTPDRGRARLGYTEVRAEVYVLTQQELNDIKIEAYERGKQYYSHGGLVMSTEH